VQVAGDLPKQSDFMRVAIARAQLQDVSMRSCAEETIVVDLVVFLQAEIEPVPLAACSGEPPMAEAEH